MKLHGSEFIDNKGLTPLTPSFCFIKYGSGIKNLLNNNNKRNQPAKNYDGHEKCKANIEYSFYCPPIGLRKFIYADRNDRNIG